MSRKILVIDDNPTQCKVIKKLFESCDFSVVALDSPEEALYLLEWKDFNVIITDLRMPWMNGAEFCRRARRTQPDMLIYALSGYIHEFDRNELVEAGFDGIFSKPIRIELLRDAIEEDLKKIKLAG
ncbi:MAG: response regulator [Desulfobacterales bacterium]|jgi:CheY-like chemotaxis protein